MGHHRAGQGLGRHAAGDRNRSAPTSTTASGSTSSWTTSTTTATAIVREWCRRQPRRARVHPDLRLMGQPDRGTLRAAAPVRHRQQRPRRPPRPRPSDPRLPPLAQHPHPRPPNPRRRTPPPRPHPQPSNNADGDTPRRPPHSARTFVVTALATSRGRQRGRFVDSDAMNAPITITLPDGSHREYPAGTTAADVAARSASGWPRRPLRRRSMATRSISAVPLRRRRSGGHHHGRHRGRPPRAAPLDRPCDGAGGHPAVPGRQVLHRPGDRERLLLRLRAARRAHVHRRRPRAHRGADARDHQGRPAVRAPRAVAPTRRSRVRRPALQGRDHRAGPSRRERGRRRARHRRGRCRRTSASTATATSSSTCAEARTCRRPAGSDTSSCRRSPARTGGATRRARCCSASTAPRGSPRPRCRRTSTSSPRPRSATTAGSPPSSTCSASRASSAAASPSGTPRARSCAS